MVIVGLCLGSLNLLLKGAEAIVLTAIASLKPMIELSLEQKFGIKSFEQQVQRMNPKQAREMLVSVYEQGMIREVMYRELIKKEWGLGEPHQH